MKKIRIGIAGYGNLGKGVEMAIRQNEDMELAGVCDVITDWRIQMAVLKKYPVFASDDMFKTKMNEAGINSSGTLNDLLASSDIIVDCTPKKIAAKKLTNLKIRRIIKNLVKSLYYKEVKSMKQPVIPLVPKIIMQLQLTLMLQE